jgi:hypothetical protein
MRRLLFILAVSAPLVALPATATATAGTAASVRACGYLRASVPYSPHGQADRWRVYVEGAASCTSATAVLDAVMHNHGHQHETGSFVSSYTTFAGWLCPYGQMGDQTCELPTRLPDHPPIRAHSLALDCSTPQDCPAHLPASAL